MVICPRCGRETPAALAHCEFCGGELLQTSLDEARNPFAEATPYAPPSKPLQPPADTLGDDPALRMLLPVGRSPYAIAAGYLGLFSVALCFLGPFAILFGILAIVDIHKNPKLVGMPRAILGITLGAIGTIGLVFAILAMALG